MGEKVEAEGPAWGSSIVKLLGCLLIVDCVPLHRIIDEVDLIPDVKEEA